MKLYEIAEAVQLILTSEVDPETGEITELGLQQLEALDLAKEKKALAVAHYILGERAEAAAVKSEADRLAQRAKVIANRAGRMERYLATHLDAGETYKDAVAQISWGTSTALELNADLEANPARLPKKYQRVKVEADKVALTKALKAGDKLAAKLGALVTRRHIRVQ